MKLHITLFVAMTLVFAACSEKSTKFIDTEMYDRLEDGSTINAEFLKFSADEIEQLKREAEIDTVDSETFDQLAAMSGTLLFDFNKEEKFHYIGPSLWKNCPPGCKLVWKKSNNSFNDFVCDCDEIEPSVDCEPRIYKRNGQLTGTCDPVDCKLNCSTPGRLFFDKINFKLLVQCNCTSDIPDPGSPSGDPGGDLFPDEGDTIPTPPNPTEN